MQKISLIFPMAGQGARFGYRFKPFLMVGDETFIQAAIAPFRPWLAQIAKVYFVYTAEQENAHAVRANLGKMFADIPHDTVILDRSTDGPAQTLERCLALKAIDGPILVCDCDHAVSVDALMQAVCDPAIACAVPTWPLEGEKLTAWSVAAVNTDGRIAAVAEKAMPECEGLQDPAFRGIIGCYYFADSLRVRRLIADNGFSHISDVMSDYLKSGQPVFSVAVQQAHFFGDPARLAEHTARHITAMGD